MQGLYVKFGDDVDVYFQMSGVYNGITYCKVGLKMNFLFVKTLFTNNLALTRERACDP